MWKKNNFKNDLKIDAKFKAHLNELVFKGYTFLKIGKKGKNIKLKTPVCKALKKIYYFENIYKSVNQNLPKDISVELVPATNYAWMKVHCLAQNPRVRIKCALQKRFSNLIKYLEDRWNSQKYNNYQIESLTNECLIKSPKNERNADETLIKDANSSVTNQNSPSSRKVFKVKPHPNHHKNLTGLRFTRIQPVPFNSQMDISLSAYLLKANSKQQLLNEQQKAKRKNLNVNCSKKSNKDEDKTANDEANNLKSLEPVNSHSVKSNTSHVLETVRELNLLNNIVSSNYKETEDGDEQHDSNQNDQLNGNQYQEEKSLHLADPPPNATIAEWLRANITNNKTEQQSAKKDESPGKETNGDVKEDEPNSKKNESQQESIYNRMKKIVDPSTIKNGWSSDEIEDLTIGELYLMLKKPNKIVLQYDWSIVDTTNQLDNTAQHAKDAKDTKNSQPIHCSTATTNCSSLVSRLITAVTIEVMSLNKEKNGSIDIENECLGKNGTKNRKTKKLKTTHCIDDHQIEHINHNENNIALSTEQISTSSNNLESAAKQAVASTMKDQQQNDNDQQSATSLPVDKFAIPCSPVPKATNKPSNKNRIVNEQQLQEAKEQLNNIKFNSTRRNFNIRKPTLMKQQQHAPQQFQLNLNTNQLLGSNLCQLIANQTGTSLTTVPVNVANSTNGQTALISVITQMNQNGNTPVQIIDGTNTIQINNATTLNDLCTFVQTNCSTNGEATNDLNHTNSLNETAVQVIPTTIVQSVPTTISSTIQTANGHHLIENRVDPNKPNQYQEFSTSLNQANTVNNLQSNTSNLQDPLELSINNLPTMNSMLNNEDKLNDDKSVGFSNLLDISLSDTIFNDSLPFPSDVSIESNFSSKDDQTLNTPIKLPLQKSTTGSHSFASQFNLFDSALGNNLGNNRTDSNNSFTDGWINNLGNDISLNNIFADCTNDKKDDLFNTNFDGVLNVS